MRVCVTVVAVEAGEGARLAAARRGVGAVGRRSSCAQGGARACVHVFVRVSMCVVLCCEHVPKCAYLVVVCVCVCVCEREIPLRAASAADAGARAKCA